MKHFSAVQLTMLVIVLLMAIRPAIAQPTVVGLSPAANQVNAARTSSVAISFSTPLNSASAAALRLFSTQRGGLRSATSGTTSVSGNQLLFTPTYTWKPGETVRSTITTLVQSSTGLALVKPKVFEFTTATGGTGLGSFIQNNTFTAGAYPNRIRLADVDGDGDLDMVSSNNTYYGGAQAPVSIRLNNGSGQFSGGSEVKVATGQYGANGLTLGDIDGDGDLDLLTSNNQDSVSVRFNNGSGGFNTGSNLFINTINNLSELTLADIDGDGDLDLLAYGFFRALPSPVVGILSVKLNNGNGQFAAGYTLSFNNVDSGFIETADVDGDGDLDLIRFFGNSGGKLYVHLNQNGDGVFSSTPSSQLPITGLFYDFKIGDLDQDGDLDLVAMDNNGLGAVYICLNNGTGIYTQGSRIAMFGNPAEIALGDIDADGDLDLLVDDNVSVSCRFNNGQGAFGGYYRLAGPRLGVFALGDIDGDNDLDLVAENAPNSPPVPPCPVYAYFNQALTPVLILGTANPLALQVTLYPNPVQQQCQLSIPELSKDATISIINSLGQNVQTIQVTASANKQFVGIDVANLIPGIYSVVLYTEAGTIVRQLSKE